MAEKCAKRRLNRPPMALMRPLDLGHYYHSLRMFSALPSAGREPTYVPAPMPAMCETKPAREKYVADCAERQLSPSAPHKTYVANCRKFVVTCAKRRLNVAEPTAAYVPPVSPAMPPTKTDNGTYAYFVVGANGANLNPSFYYNEWRKRRKDSENDSWVEFKAESSASESETEDVTSIDSGFDVVDFQHKNRQNKSFERNKNPENLEKSQKNPENPEKSQKNPENSQKIPENSENPENPGKNKKKVTFQSDDQLCRIYKQVVHAFARQSARQGHCWQQCAIDRRRFHARCQQVSTILEPILNEEFRDRIYGERFDKSGD